MNATAKRVVSADLQARSDMLNLELVAPLVFGAVMGRDHAARTRVCSMANSDIGVDRYRRYISIVQFPQPSFRIVSSASRSSWPFLITKFQPVGFLVLSQMCYNQLRVPGLFLLLVCIVTNFPMRFVHGILYRIRKNSGVCPQYHECTCPFLGPNSRQ